MVSKTQSLAQNVSPPTHIANTNIEQDASTETNFSWSEDRSRFNAASSTRAHQGVSHEPDAVTQERQVILNKSRDQGKTQRADTAQEFAVIIACYSEILGKPSGNIMFCQPQLAALIAEAAELYSRCKNIARSLKARRPGRNPTQMSTSVVMPDDEVVDAMVNVYLNAFESTHRIIHIPSFKKDYSLFRSHPESISPVIRLQVLLVMCIGSSLYDHGTTHSVLQNTQLAQQCIYEAEIWLAGPLEKSRIGIAAVQIQCLTILARQIFSLGDDTIWVSIGSLTHAAIQLGLHRDPKHLREMSLLEAELRRRLWATILDLTVQAALDSSLPPRISLEEFDTEPPSNLNDDEIDQPTCEVQSHPSNTFTSTSVQITLLKSLPTRLRIVQQLSNLRSELTYPHALTLSNELTHALRSNYSLTTSLDGITMFHKNMLDYLVRRFMIPLHYSFSHQSRTNPDYFYSLKLSADAARAIVRPDGSDTQFAQLISLGGGMFRGGFRGAITILALELLILAQDQRLDGTLSRASTYREPFKEGVRELVVLSDERIRRGETNVKSHMFLSMALAQVTAIENDMPLEDAVLRGAKDSLEHCLGVVSGSIDGGASMEMWNGSLAAEENLGNRESFSDLEWEFSVPELEFL